MKQKHLRVITTGNFSLLNCDITGPSTLATLFNHMWPRIVAGIFIPVGNHYFQALASTLQFVAQVCDRLWLVPATDRAFAYITYMSPPHVALVCSGPPQCAATCGWTKWPVCSGPTSEMEWRDVFSIEHSMPDIGAVFSPYMHRSALEFQRTTNLVDKNYNIYLNFHYDGHHYMHGY